MVLPLMAFALMSQLMQGEAKDRADRDQLRTMNDAKRRAASTRDMNRKGILSLLPGEAPGARMAAASDQAAQTDAATAAARQQGLAQFAGSQGSLDGLSAGQVAQVGDAANRRVGATSGILAGMQGRMLAESSRGRQRRGILGQNQLNEDALNRSLGPLDSQLYADQARYKSLYDAGGLVGAIGVGMDSNNIWSSAAQRAAAGQQGGGAAGQGYDGAGFSWGGAGAGGMDSRGSQPYVDESGQLVYPS